MLEKIRTFALAERVFSTPTRADRWMGRPNRALGMRRPVDVVETEDGFEQVQAVLDHLGSHRRSDHRSF